MSTVSLKKVKFDEICLLVTDGTHDSPKLQPTGVPFIKGKHISSGDIDFNNCDYISDTDHRLCIKRVSPQKYDVLLSNIGSVGDCAQVKTEEEFSIKNVALLRPNMSKIDANYFFYLFKNPVFKADLLNLRAGSAQQFISLAALRGFQFTLIESTKEQSRIANILLAYDKLIENNRRRIALLEDAARLLYREWFVFFRFPGHEHIKITNGVPEGWDKACLERYVMFSNGKALRNGAIGDYPMYGANGIVRKTEKHLFDSGVIVGRVGAYCGSTMLAPSKFWGSDNTIIAQSAHNSIGLYFLYFMLSALDLNRFAGGSAQPLLTQTNLKKIEAVFPTKFLCGEFDVFARDIFTEVNLLKSQNERLVQARDLLLPRLMDGKVEV